MQNSLPENARGQRLSTRPRRSASRATALEFFPLLAGKREESKGLVSVQKSGGQPLKGKMHDLDLMPPREAMDLGTGDIHAVVGEWFSRTELKHDFEPFIQIVFVVPQRVQLAQRADNAIIDFRSLLRIRI